MIFALLAVIINALLGCYVLLKNPRKATNIFFSLMAFSIGLWNIAEVIIYFLKDHSLALFWDRFSYIGAILVPPFSMHFMVSIVETILKRNWKKIILVCYSYALVLLCFVFTPFIIKDVFIKPYKEIVGGLYYLFAIFFVVCFLYELYILFLSLKSSAGIKKLQLTYLFFSYSFGLFATLVYFFILTAGFNISPIIYMIETGYMLAVSYAILRYRLMDIKIVITRAGIFSFVYLLALGIPFIIGAFLKSHLSQITSNWWVFSLFLMALLASVAPFVYMRLQKRFEARLRAEEFKTHEALRRLSHNMLRFTNLNVLLRLIVHYLVKILRLNFASIYLFDSQTNKYLLSSLWHSGIERPNLPDHFELDDYLIELLYLKRTPILREELSIYAPNAFTERIKKLFFFLSKSEINIIIPSFLRNYLIGFVVLSDRKNRIPFSQEDINLLMVLSNEAALAIENAQFHQRELSSILESSRREALADMAPGASHQFNNRLAAISSSVELLLYKLESLNDKDPQNGTIKDALSDIKATLNMINQEVYKGKEITSAILKRAKAKVEFQEFNIINLIDNAYKLVMISHAHSDRDKLKEIRFRIDSFKKDVTILASEALLQDVFYNLIDNSCDAIQEKARLIKEGGLEEDSNFIGLIEILLRQEDSTLIIQIKDDGIGLTKENLRKLFTPYFTTKATSNKGSGLGLCVIRDFIEMHKGSIVCESEYTKGTTFTIRLPMGKESHYKVEKV